MAHSELIKRVAPVEGAVVKVVQRFKAEKEGDTSISMPFRLLSRLVGGGLRRRFTSVVAGPPSNGKSYFAYNMMLHCMARGYKALYLPLEYEPEDHLRRILATHINSWTMNWLDRSFSFSGSARYTSPLTSRAMRLAMYSPTPSPLGR